MDFSDRAGIAGVLEVSSPIAATASSCLPHRGSGCRPCSSIRPGRPDVHRPVHGQDGRFRQELLPGLPARRIRQGDRLSGFSSRSSPVIRLIGASGRCSPSSVVCALLTYGGVSLFVVVFRGVSVRGRDVPPGRHPQAPDPGHHRPGRLLVHDGRCRARRRSRTSSRPPFQDRHLRRALAGRIGGLFIFVSAWPTSNGAVAACGAAARATAKAWCNEPEPFDDENLAIR